MGSKRVIIVHPDANIGGRLSSRLYRTGLFAVDTAQDGFEAAAKLYAHRYDCLILHSRTPGMQPLRAINMIRGAAGMERMPILVLCSGTDPTAHQTLRSLVDTYVLVEPIDPGELTDTAIRLTRGPDAVEVRLIEESASEPDPLLADMQPPPENNAPAPWPVEKDVFAPPATRMSARTPAARAPEPAPGAAADPELTPADDADAAAGRDPEALHPRPRGEAEEDLTDEAQWHRPTGPVGKESTAVGMGLTDLIWYRAERGDPIPGLPPGVSRLDDLLSGRLGDVLSKDLLGIDQSLAIAVLRQSNSAEFSGMEKLGGLDQAMLRVGQRSLARHMMATWEARSKISRATREFMLGDYWRHCLMVACIAEEIAAHLRYRSCDAVFSAGLLHDVGKLFFIAHFHEDYARVRAMAAAALEPSGGPQDISQYERELLKVDHGVIGYELCQAWLLPPVVQAGTLHHHLNSDRVRRLPDSLVTIVVALANLVEHTLYRLQEERYAAGRGGDPTLSDLDADMEAVTQDVLQEFYKSIYSSVPFWVHQFLRGKHLPLRLVYGSAMRRVKRAVRRAEMQAYCPPWAGGSLGHRKAG